MTDAITLDVTDQLNTFNKLASSMDFIISKSMNDISFEKGRKNLSKHMSNELTERNKNFFKPSAIKFKRSNKRSLKIEIFHIKEQLGLQQSGGVELPDGKKLAIPVRRNLSKYAGVPNNKNIPKSLKIDTILKKAPRMNDKSKVYNTKGIKPFIGKRGVYIRVNEGLRLIYVFSEKAKHRKKLINFQKEIERTFNVNLDRYIERQYLKILKG